MEALSYEHRQWSSNIIPKKEHVLQKTFYLHEYFANRDLPAKDRLQEVYMDESYIHEYYNCNDNSLWDPSDKQDLQINKAPTKRSCYYFAAAIQGPDPRVVQHKGLSKEWKASLVPGTVWAFCPQRKRAHTGDYHKVFHGQNFLDWWKNQLLPNLNQPSLIIMDNAAYHKVKFSTPKLTKMKKEDVQNWLQETKLMCQRVWLPWNSERRQRNTLKTMCQ